MWSPDTNTPNIPVASNTPQSSHSLKAAEAPLLIQNLKGWMREKNTPDNRAVEGECWKEAREPLLGCSTDTEEINPALTRHYQTVEIAAQEQRLIELQENNVYRTRLKRKLMVSKGKTKSHRLNSNLKLPVQHSGTLLALVLPYCATLWSYLFQKPIVEWMSNSFPKINIAAQDSKVTFVDRPSLTFNI